VSRFVVSVSGQESDRIVKTLARLSTRFTPPGASSGPGAVGKRTIAHRQAEPFANLVHGHASSSSSMTNRAKSRDKWGHHGNALSSPVQVAAPVERPRCGRAAVLKTCRKM
jgi:hypothetical protein